MKFQEAWDKVFEAVPDSVYEHAEYNKAAGEMFEGVAEKAANIYADAAREEERAKLNIWHPATELPVVSEGELKVECFALWSSGNVIEWTYWRAHVTISNDIEKWCYASELAKQAGAV